MKKLNRRDERFAKLVADAKEAPGFCYAQSRDREYKGFNDDYQAERLLKDADISEAVRAFKAHIITRDVLSRQEALVNLTSRFRAPSSGEILKEIMRLESLRLEPEVLEAQIKKIDFSGIKGWKRNKAGMITSVVEYDLGVLAARILNMAGVDVSKPITDEGKSRARKLLLGIYDGEEDAGGKEK
jgi:hypothetical protein